jgi:uncharacterized protein YjeT (DUF2065 family)
MNTLSSILFWLGIVALVDGSFGLLFKEKWQKMAGNLDIQKLAFLEIGVAFVLLGAHFLIGFLVLR